MDPRDNDRWPRELARFFVLGFALAAALIIGVTNVLHGQWLRGQRRAAFAGAPESALDLSKPSAESARAAGYFWLLDCTDLGAALRLLQDRTLFSSVFPGYEATLSDAAFWKRYFSLVFDSQIVSPLLIGARQAHVMTSWGGALELMRVHGADVVLYGSSEMFHAVIPSRLQAALGGNQRVLNLGCGSMLTDTVTRTADAAAASGQRSRLAVWGYSLWNAYHPPKYEAVKARLDHSYRRWAGDALSDEESIRDRITPRWDVIVRLSLQEVWYRRKGAWRPANTIPAGLLPGSPEFASAAAALTSTESEFEGITPAACDTSQATLELDAALASILRSSDRVLIYIPPTTPVMRRAAPPCYEAAVKKMLLSRRGPRVEVRTDDWRQFGLDYPDYAKPGLRPGSWWIDTNHVNLAGAEKVTARIARWAAAHPGMPAARSHMMFGAASAQK